MTQNSTLVTWFHSITVNNLLSLVNLQNILTVAIAATIFTCKQLVYVSVYAQSIVFKACYGNSDRTVNEIERSGQLIWVLYNNDASLYPSRLVHVNVHLFTVYFYDVLKRVQVTCSKLYLYIQSTYMKFWGW